MDINSLISKKETLVSNQFDDAIHVALCFDKNYGLPAGVLVTSILHNNPDKNFIFHLFVLSINDDDIEKFKLFNNGNVKIELYYVNDNFSINPKTIVLPYLSIATCLRLFVPEYLSGITEKLLYLDCDMICNGDLYEIIKTNIDNEIIATVLDLKSAQKTRAGACNLKPGTYFNAGMLYINTKLWKNNSITKKALDKINDGNVYTYADQDILNIILTGKVQYIPLKNNRMEFKKNRKGRIDNSILNTTVIFHYYGENKPWYLVNIDDLYFKYFKISFWKDVKLKMINKKNTSSLRKYSKYYYRKGDYITAIKYRILYFLVKLNLIKAFNKYL